MNIFQKSLALLVSWSLVIGTVWGGVAYASQSDQSEAQPTDSGSTQSPEELQQLVAPIALYPRIGFTDPRRRDVSHGNCGSKPLDSGASEPAGTGARERGRQATMGPQRQGANAVPLRVGQHGQEPLLDFLAGRCLRKPAAGRNGCGAGDARSCAKSGEFEEQ